MLVTELRAWGIWITLQVIHPPCTYRGFFTSSSDRTGRFNSAMQISVSPKSLTPSPTHLWCIFWKISCCFLSELTLSGVCNRGLWGQRPEPFPQMFTFSLTFPRGCQEMIQSPEEVWKQHVCRYWVASHSRFFIGVTLWINSPVSD